MPVGGLVVLRRGAAGRAVPQAAVFQNFLNNISLVAFFDEGYDGHGTATLRAFQRINFVYPFYQRRPAHPAEFSIGRVFIIDNNPLPIGCLIGFRPGPLSPRFV